METECFIMNCNQCAVVIFFLFLGTIINSVNSESTDYIPSI